MADGIQGRLWVLKAGDGASPEVFTTVAKLTSTTLNISQAVVEQTSKDDAPNRQLLANTGIRSFSAEIAGFWDGGTTQEAMDTKLRAGTINSFQLTDGTNTYAGEMQVTAFSLTGGVDDVVTFTATLEGTGTITYT